MSQLFCQQADRCLPMRSAVHLDYRMTVWVPRNKRDEIVVNLTGWDGGEHGTDTIYDMLCDGRCVECIMFGVN